MQEASPEEIDEPKTRPTGVSIIAVLAIVFGGLGLFCITPYSLYQNFFASGPGAEMIRSDSTIQIVSIAGLVIGAFFQLILLILGFGLWKLKGWARKGAVVYAIFSVLWTLANSAMVSLYVLPRTLELLKTQGQKLPPGFEAGFYWTMLGTLGVCSCMTIAIDVVIAVYLTRPTVKQAFAKV